MKRGRPLARRIGLKTNTPLRSKEQPKRIGLTPGSSSAQPKRAPMKPYRPKRTAEEVHGRKVVQARSLVGDVRMCEICGQERATEWHHRMNRSQLGGWGPANGLDLCHRDHAMVTDTRPEFYENGWCVKSWQDPLMVPVLYRGRWVLLDDKGGMTDVGKESAA